MKAKSAKRMDGPLSGRHRSKWHLSEKFRVGKKGRVPKTAVVFVLMAFLGFFVCAQPSLCVSAVDIQNMSLAISPDERTAVASSSERACVLVYNLETNNVRGVLSQFITPRNILFEPAGRFFYVTDSTLGVVEKIDTGSLKTISILQANPGAFGIALSRDGRTLYVNNEAASIVWAFDLISDERVTLITQYSRPHGSEPSLQNTSTLYVIDSWSNRIRIVDLATNRIGGDISGFDKLRAIAITKDGRTIFAANEGTDSIAVVDVASHSILRQIPVGKNPRSLTLSPDENFVYSANLADNTLSIVTLPSFQLVATICGFTELPQAIALARDGSQAFVLNWDLSISLVDLATNRFAYTIPSQAEMHRAGFKKRRTHDSR